MPRTTLDIDAPLLDEVRRLQQQSAASASGHRSMGAIVSELLAEALDQRRRGGSGEPEPFRWDAQPMGARVDLTDKDALYAVLDESGRYPTGPRRPREGWMVAEPTTPYDAGDGGLDDSTLDDGTGDEPR